MPLEHLPKGWASESINLYGFKIAPTRAVFIALWAPGKAVLKCSQHTQISMDPMPVGPLCRWGPYACWAPVEIALWDHALRWPCPPPLFQLAPQNKLAMIYAVTNVKYLLLLNSKCNMSIYMEKKFSFIYSYIYIQMFLTFLFIKQNK